MKHIKVELPDKKYDIIIESGALNRIFEYIPGVFPGNHIYLITDSNVADIYSQRVRKALESKGYKIFIHVIKAGELSKNIYELNNIYKFLVNSGASRKDLIIALGGGVIGDMAGFAAATYMRGIKYIQIPTTLLAQIDSSVGGKTAVNLDEGKNLVGAFYHPEMVIIDPECLRTLPQRVLSDGSAEALKYAYMEGGKLYDIFRNIKNAREIYDHIEDIIYLSCCIKRDIVQRDEKEKNERMLLNFGHTLGHAYENYYNYNKYTHGEAVALGMSYICGICEESGIAPKGTHQEMTRILTNLNLPGKDEHADKREIMKRLFSDKKSNSQFTSFILIKDIGQVYIQKINNNDIERFLTEGGYLGESES